jgi:hypothetical protein
MKKTYVNLIRWSNPEIKKQVVDYARRKGQSVNGLVNQWAQIVLAQEQAEASFRAAVGRGQPQRLIRLLEEMDRDDQRRGIARTRP